MEGTNTSQPTLTLEIRARSAIPPSFDLPRSLGVVAKLLGEIPCINTTDKVISIQRELPKDKGHQTLEGLAFGLGGSEAVVRIPSPRAIYSECYKTKVNMASEDLFPYLVLHEVGHLCGLAHCHMPMCVMGIRECGGRERYCWECVAAARDSRPFCSLCLGRLYR